MPAFFFPMRSDSMERDHSPFSERIVVEDDNFQFDCHSRISCFLTCCCDVNMLLFPYDIILMKNAVVMHSADFLREYTTLCPGSHPYFPGLQLKLRRDERRSCPFLTETGCGIYANRPSSCRTYPLERGIESTGHGEPLRAHYFLTKHPYCQGHFESRQYSLSQWERDQMLHECNYYNDLWAELDAFFATNPWEGEGYAGPYQQLAFMVCYNIDAFRLHLQHNNLLNKFSLSKVERRRIQVDDGALLRFGFHWLEFILGGKRKLTIK